MFDFPPQTQSGFLNQYNTTIQFELASCHTHTHTHTLIFCNLHAHEIEWCGISKNKMKTAAMNEEEEKQGFMVRARQYSHSLTCISTYQELTQT